MQFSPHHAARDGRRDAESEGERRGNQMAASAALPCCRARASGNRGANGEDGPDELRYSLGKESTVGKR